MVMSDLPNGRALARAFMTDQSDVYAVNQRVCSITVKEGDGRYFLYQLNRNPGLLCNDDGLNQTHLSNSDFKTLHLVVPPLGEQTQIATFLDGEIARVDGLTKQAGHSTVLLRERRAALISAAVTGKIDVRGLVPLAEPARETA